MPRLNIKLTNFNLYLKVIFPLEFCNVLGKVDVVATCEGNGFSGKVGAIRLGIAMCLRSFVDAETTERMRLGNDINVDHL